MTMFRKSSIAVRLKELDEYYLKLRKELEGSKPDPFFASAYGYKKDEFVEQCAYVDLDELLVKVEHFKAEAFSLRKFKAKCMKLSTPIK